MLSYLRRILVNCGIVGAFLGTIFIVGFLQEASPDDLVGKIHDAGRPAKLEDPRIEVSLSHMTLTLYDGDVKIQRYDIGFGSGPIGRSGDRKQGTPTGEYRILRKQKRADMLSRGSRFLILDYPTVEDAERAYSLDAITLEDFQRIRTAHSCFETPPYDTPLGGPIGIQGNYFFFLQRRFTDGSVALTNSAINEVFDHVPVGTRVLIKDE